MDDRKGDVGVVEGDQGLETWAKREATRLRLMAEALDRGDLETAEILARIGIAYMREDLGESSLRDRLAGWYWESGPGALWVRFKDRRR